MQKTECKLQIANCKLQIERGSEDSSRERSSASGNLRFAICILQFAICLFFLLEASGCQQRMAKQPSIRPDEESTFFPDGRASRPVVPGTVARGHLRTDTPMYTGRTTRRGHQAGRAAALAGIGIEGNVLNILAGLGFGGGDYDNVVDAFPFPVTYDVIDHGRNRYMIFCVVCHDPLGTGRGKIVERGYTRPPSYHIERLRKAPVGHFFAVMTEGYGSMPDYRQQIPPRDRWAIAAYIRALQLSQHFPERDLPPDLRRELDARRRAAGGGGKAP